MYASQLKDASRQRLAHDLENLVSDGELFLSASAGQAGETYDRAVKKLGTALDAAKARVTEVERGIVDNTCAATSATDAYVHANAWKAVAVAAGVGLIAGLLVMRR